MHTVFGLDFGTTNSALAVNAQGRMEVIDNRSAQSHEKNDAVVIFMDKEQAFTWTGSDRAIHRTARAWKVHAID